MEGADNRPAREQSRLSSKDFDLAAESIADEQRRRAAARRDLEQQWREIDRQVAMVPVKTNVDPVTGTIDRGTEWKPFVEPPFQAQTLETLSADARRLLFPDDRNFFSAHALVGDDYLERVERRGILAGDRAEVRSKITQDDADSLVEAVHMHFHDQYRFRDVWNALNVDAFKYGTFAARGRIARAEEFAHDPRGVIRRTGKLPVLVHMDIRSVYLDSPESYLRFTDTIMRPSPIFHYRQKLGDLRLAARSGEGWLPQMLRGVENSDADMIEMMEYEGDLLMPSPRGRSVFVPNMLITVMLGKWSGGAGGSKTKGRIVRVREAPFKGSSYLVGRYHAEDSSSVYGMSPLLKGLPLQKIIANTLNSMIHVAILNAEPPIAYDPASAWFAQRGGPVIQPRALWRDTGITVHRIGDIAALQAMYFALVTQYQEVTGVSSPRLGSQTKSHQTAFAIDSEVQRGVIRTVDYVREILDGPMRTWLSMEYAMIREALTSPTPIYSPKLMGWLRVSGDDLPETTTYDVHGVSGPLEETERRNRQIAAIQMLTNIEPLAVQAGSPPLNWEEIRRWILSREFADLDPFLAAASLGGPAAAGAGIPPGFAPGSDLPGLVESISPNQLIDVAAAI